MKIRFFNTYEPVSPFYRDLIPFLASLDVKSEVIVSAGVYRHRPSLQQAIGESQDVKVIVTPSLGLDPTSKLSKIVVTVSYAVLAAVRSLFGARVDINVFLTQPPLFTLWGYLLSKIRGQPYFCVVMDLYPQEAIEMGLLPRDSFIAKVSTYLSALALQNAEGLIVIGRCMADCVAELDVPRENIHFIPNWIDETTVQPVEPEVNRIRKDEGWEGKFIVLYGGNIGMAQYFDDILSVVESLQSDDRILFVFIGNGSQKGYIESWAQARGLPNLVLLPFLQDRYSLGEILSVGDVQFISLKESCTGLGVPSKAYGSLAVGRPIIYQGGAAGEIARMVVEEDIGSVVPPAGTHELRQAVLEYASNPDLLERQGRKARRLAEGRYSRGRALKRYIELLLSEKL